MKGIIRVLRSLMCGVALLAALSGISMAKGVSPYLPLNISPEIESHIDQVIALTPYAPIKKPYSAADIQRRVESIRDRYPLLAQRVNAYLQRYKVKAGITHLSAEISESSDSVYPLANMRNQRINEHYAVSGGGISYLNPNVMASSGITYSARNGITHQQSFVALGWDVFQVDIGYREHWFSPFKDSAMLVSTHAKASPSITLSNSKPLTKWQINYEVFYSKLEPVEEIILGEEAFPGHPRHAGVYLSFNPLKNWTIGFNRTMQFGGGQRKVGFSDVFEAFFDPAGKDNVGDANNDDPNFEFGNQQASISTQFNFELGMPISLYGEYSGEDTVNESNFSLGNATSSIGIYLPQVTPKLSTRLELVDMASVWYVHHLYPDGYVNDGQIMGHWAASLRQSGSETAAKVLALKATWEVSSTQIIDASFRYVNLENRPNEQYQKAKELRLRYSHATKYGLFGIDTIIANDAQGSSANRLALFYRW